MLLTAFAGNVVAQCGNITFSADKTSSCSPAVIHFAAQNAPHGSNFFWNTGNGFSSGKDSLTKSFVQSGTFTISLIVQLPGGTFCDTIVRKDYINILPSPSPVIHASPSRFFCNGGQSVTLTDSTPTGVSRDWIVDGTQYTNAQKSITVNFPSSASGNKAVTLQVRNSTGCEGVLTQSNYIQIFNQPEVMEMCITTTEINDSLVANFTTNIVANQTISAYSWSFPTGKPTSSNQRNAGPIKFPANSSGTHQITLTITTTNGCQYSITKSLGKLVSVDPDTICPGEIVTATHFASGDGRGFYGWNIPGADVEDQQSNKIDLKYRSSGKFNLALSYKYSEKGCVSSYTLPGAVTVLPPTSRFAALPSSACFAPQKVNFYNSSIPGGPNTTYTWRIYDSLMNELPGSPIGPTTKKDTAYTFAKTGTYSVALITNVPNGCKDSLMKENAIRVDRPIADFKVSDTTVCTKGSIKLEDNSFPPPSPGNNYTYKWKVWHADSPSIAITFSSKENLFIPTTPGVYHVEYSVFSDKNCGDTIYKMNFLKVNGIEAEVNLDKSHVCRTDTVNASSAIIANVPDTSANTISYLWEAHPDHASKVVFHTPDKANTKMTFKGSGCIPITLKIFNTFGCILFINKTVCVGIQPDYNFVDTSYCTNHVLRLKDSTFGMPLAYRWFANPPTATFSPSANVASPTVEFHDDTCYKLSLVAIIDTVRNCGDTMTKNVCIEEMKAEFSTDDTLMFCAPKTAVFSTQGSKGATNFEWHFGDGTIINTTNPSPAYTFAKNNPLGFDVMLKIGNDIGCKDSLIKEDLIKIIGPVPRFTVDKNYACDSITVTFTNHSYNVASYVLDFDDGSIDSTKFKDSLNTITHTFGLNNLNADSALYVVTMVARDVYNCPEAFRDTIIVYRTPIADFTADTVTGCAPLDITFNNTSLGARIWQWDFDEDGVIDDSVATPTFRFLNADTFDIYLEVEGAGGCKSDVLKKGFIKLAPEIIPSFTMDTITGCDSLRVKFTNTSQYFHYFSMDYGNGAPKDSNMLKTAQYKYDHQNMTGDSVIFYPEITVYNSFGCRRTYKDSIVIYPTPIPAITPDVAIGCDPLRVQFQGPSRFVAGWEWDFNTDGVIDNTDTTPVAYFNQGHHAIYLRVTSRHGCSADLTVPKMISVYVPPQAAFHSSDTMLCPGDTVYYSDLTFSPYRINTFEWSFTGGKDSISSQRKPEHVIYTDPGDYEVTLAVIDEHGCADTIVKPAHIHVKSNLPPPTTNPMVVTVTDSVLVEITWEKSQLPDFAEYKLYRNTNPPTEIYSTNNLEDTQFVELPVVDVHSGSNCYFIRTVDECGNVSFNSEEHCTIVLDVQSAGASANQLTWNAYTGWPAVQQYEVYRSDSGGTYKLLGTTTTTDFLDDELCDIEYCYYIVAISPEGLRSRSNFDCNNPPYVYQDSELEMRRTTVIDDSYTLTEWKEGKQDNIKEYYLSKLDPRFGWQEKFTKTTNLFYNDFEVEVDSNFYQYKVQVLDECGNISPISDISTSIQLVAAIENDKVLLTWNHYREWPQDVLYYIVEYAPPGKSFTKIAVLPGSDSTYIDEKIYQNNDSFYCYRITAIENSFTETDTSVSNVTCTALPSRLFIPNAFTPNGDGHNDTFKVSVLSIYNIPASDVAYFRFVVYDRWGNHIFETNDQHSGWDGTFRGRPAPEGVYIYLVRARGYDGKDYDLNGNVTLLRKQR